MPIQPTLIDELGFNYFVQAKQDSGSKKLFPELKKANHRNSHSVSKWFNGVFLEKKAGIKTNGGKKVFHSFRHTITNTCKLAGIPEDKVSQILGHETPGGNITYIRYGKKYPADVLFNDVISKIDFNIDIGRLKKSKYAGRKGLTK